MKTPAVHAVETTASVVNVAPVVSATAVSDVPPSPVSQVSVRRLSRFDAMIAADAEIAWLHSAKSQSDDAATVQARKTIEGWLAVLPSFHRGAITLEHDRRPVPESLQKHIKGGFAFILRMEMAARPSDGTKTVAELEAAAIARIELAVLLDGPRAIRALRVRASENLDAAMTAYTKVRGRVPSVIPAR